MTEKNYPPYDDYDPLDVASANDCTGLIPTPPTDEAEMEAYGELCKIPITEPNEKSNDIYYPYKQ